MTWPQGKYEPSVEWWQLGEEGRKPILDAIALLGFSPTEVQIADFGPTSATFTVLHREKGSAHMEGHCEQPVVMRVVDGEMACNCGRKMGEGHYMCRIVQEVEYPA